MQNNLAEVLSFDEDTAVTIFKEFGLPPEIFTQAVEASYHERINCTNFHPKTAAGTRQWHEVVAVTRRLASDFGWYTEDKQNYPLCVHPSGEIAIAFVTGNSDTGQIGGAEPSNKARKGPVTERVVGKNAQMLLPFIEFEDEILVSTELVNENTKTWILLYYVAADGIRYELSLPKEMVCGHIKAWDKRIIFPAIDLDPSVTGLIGPDDEPDIDIIVQRHPL